MGRPGPATYRGRHAHPRPASGRAASPRAVVAAGLAGLAKRTASVDGTFEIVSPPGGPTLLTVDLPCTR